MADDVSGFNMKRGSKSTNAQREETSVAPIDVEDFDDLASQVTVKPNTPEIDETVLDGFD